MSIKNKSSIRFQPEYGSFGSEPVEWKHGPIPKTSKWSAHLRCECGGLIEVIRATFWQMSGVPCDSCDKTYTIEHIEQQPY